MIRIGFLFLSLLISVVYLLFPNSGAVGFAYSDMVVTIQTWVWMFGEHMAGGGIMVAIYVLLTEKKYTLCSWAFFIIHVVDTVDYMLTYSEPWGPNQVITFNTMKCLIFVLVMFLDFNRNVESTGRN